MYCIKKPDCHQIIVELPSSKSVTHRILILAALNSGKTIIKNALDAEDTEITLKALQNMGASFEVNGSENENSHVVKDSNFLKDGISSEIHVKRQIGQVQNNECYLGYSGSSARFLPPLASFVDKKVRFFGEPRLHERPFAELVDALRRLGAKIESENNSLPFDVYPGVLIGGTIYFETLPSSQIITSLMMSALWMEKDLIIKLSDNIPSLPYITMTYRLMRNLGLEVQFDGNEIFVKSGKPDINWNFKVEKDLSSVSYWVVFGLLHGIKVILPGVTLPSLQGDEKMFEIAEQVGAQVILYPDRVEIDGKIEMGFEMDCSGTPDLVPALSVLGLFAPEKVVLKNIKHLEYKESNRIEAVQKNISILGGNSDYAEEQLVIHPQKKYRGGIVNTYNDHRIALSFAIAGSRIENVCIDNPQCVSKSYPQFWEHFTFWESKD